MFASRNPWAVTQFDFGLKDDHAEKMGEALELIVNSATKPQVLAHKLYILAIGHVQMGIKASMFPAFEEALFDFLKTVQCLPLTPASPPPPPPSSDSFDAE